VKLAGRRAAVVLTEDGREVLEFASIDVPQSNLFLVVVYETDELGLWIQFQRGAEEHFFLLRWEYILAIDVLDEGGKKLFGIVR